MRAEVVAGCQCLGRIEQARRMQCQDKAVATPRKGVGAQHNQRLDGKLAQRGKPIGDDAVEHHTVKVSR